jgi:CBS domain containing-hemolysin-like protein
MTVLLMIVGGLILGMVGVATAAASRAADQVELYRWITNRQDGAASARALLAAPSRVVGAALGIASAGTILTGIGVRALLDTLSPVVIAAVTILLVIPLAIICMHSLPSIIGRRWPETTVRLTASVVSRFSAIFAAVQPSGSSVHPRVDLARSQLQRASGDKTSVDDLSLVSGVLEFTERQVKEVMTPRTEVVAVADSAVPAHICNTFVESGYSRLPVYSESLDNIVGMYYAFDLLKLTPAGQLPVRPVTLVPMTRPCADLLFEMQRDRRQVAVVLDEFGGTAGIATLNDLLADLVEETFETPSGTHVETPRHPGVVEVAGTATASDIAQKFEVSFPSGAETIGGLLSGAVGRIPVAGERFELSGLEFDVIEATPTRVERLTVRRAVGTVTRLESLGDE